MGPVKISCETRTPLLVKGWPESNHGAQEGVPIYAVLYMGDSMDIPSFDYQVTYAKTDKGSFVNPNAWPEKDITRSEGPE